VPSNDVVLLADMLERDFASFVAVGDDHETYFTARQYLRNGFERRTAECERRSS